MLSCGESIGRHIEVCGSYEIVCKVGGLRAREMEDDGVDA